MLFNLGQLNWVATGEHDTAAILLLYMLYLYMLLL